MVRNKQNKEPAVRSSTADKLLNMPPKGSCSLLLLLQLRNCTAACNLLQAAATQVPALLLRAA
jgi:hypothetical protein